MKNRILSLSLMLILSIFSSYAATPEEKKPTPNKAIISQVHNMLDRNTIPNEIRGTKAEVRVAVDHGNFLRILSIETESEALESFIRTNIDFQKLTKGAFEQGIVYRIPLEVRN